MAVVLTGAGEESFCASADLKEISSGDPPCTQSTKNGFAWYVHHFIDKPTIAAANGTAAVLPISAITTTGQLTWVRRQLTVFLFEV
jgi:enoyl-CoA hydratase/carnithine racemase